MTTAARVLLPPSEGKAEGGRTGARAGAFDAALTTERAAVVRALGAAVRTPAGAAKVLGCRGDLLDRARAATAALVAGTAPRLPAAERYTGVVWEHLGPLTAPARARVLVPSAVYGITTAADPIADYRAKLSVQLPGVGRLDRFWVDPVTTVLARHARNRVLVDLLPTEHARAIDWARLEAQVEVVRVAFLRADGAGAAGHGAKAAKGRFARVVLDDGLAAARRFRWEGWRAVGDGDGIAVLGPGR
ncbi:MAG: peroxide stress protein YaaA [Actinomycetota bacterium]